MQIEVFLGSIHTTPEEFENAALFLRLDLPLTLIRHKNIALFLRLGLPSTVIRHWNAAFRKRPSNRRNLKTPALSFGVNRKLLKTKLSENDVKIILSNISLPEFYCQTQIQNGRWVLRFKIPPV